MATRSKGRRWSKRVMETSDALEVLERAKDELRAAFHRPARPPGHGTPSRVVRTAHPRNPAAQGSPSKSDGLWNLMRGGVS